MEVERPRFPAEVQFFTWLFIIGYSLFPLGYSYKLAERHTLPAHGWLWAVAAVALLQVIFLYVQRRCSSEVVTYWEGMNYVSYSMYAGSSYLAFFFILPAQALLLAASLLIALYGEVRRKPEAARQTFARLVHLFYKNRMVQ